MGVGKNGVVGDVMQPDLNVKAQMRAVAGSDNIGVINERLKKNTDRLREISQTPQDQMTGKLAQEIVDLNSENKNLVKALGMAADASKRLSGIMDRLAQIEAEKEGRKNINEEIATGGIKAVRQMAMEDQAARMAIKRGKLREDIQNPMAARENEMALKGLDRMGSIDARGAVPAALLRKLGIADSENADFNMVKDKLLGNFQAKLPGEINNRNQANAILKRRGVQGVDNGNSLDDFESRIADIDKQRGRAILQENAHRRLKADTKIIQQGSQKNVKEGERFETNKEKALRLDAEKARELVGASRIKNEPGAAKKEEEARLKQAGKDIVDNASVADNSITTQIGTATETFMQKLLQIQNEFFSRLEGQLMGDANRKFNEQINPLQKERAGIVQNNMAIEASRKELSRLGGGLTQDQIDYATSNHGFEEIKKVNESQQRLDKLDQLSMLTGKGSSKENVEKIREQLGQMGEFGAAQSKIFEEFITKLGGDSNVYARKIAVKSLREEVLSSKDKETNTQIEAAKAMNGRFGVGISRGLNLDEFSKERDRLKGLGHTGENNKRISEIDAEIKRLESERSKALEEARRSAQQNRRDFQIPGNAPPNEAAQQNQGAAIEKKAIPVANKMGDIFGGLITNFTGFMKSFDNSAAMLSKSLDMLQGAKIEIAGTTRVDINLTGGEALLKIGEAVRKEVMVAVGEKLKQSFPGNTGQIAANFPSGNTNQQQSGSNSGAVA